MSGSAPALFLNVGALPATSSITPLPPSYTQAEQGWIQLSDNLTLDLSSQGRDTTAIPAGTSRSLIHSVDEAFNEGYLTGSGIPTEYSPVQLT